MDLLYVHTISLRTSYNPHPHFSIRYFSPFHLIRCISFLPSFRMSKQNQFQNIRPIAATADHYIHHFHPVYFLSNTKGIGQLNFPKFGLTNGNQVIIHAFHVFCPVTVCIRIPGKRLTLKAKLLADLGKLIAATVDIIPLDLLFSQGIRCFFQSLR